MTAVLERFFDELGPAPAVPHDDAVSLDPTSATLHTTAGALYLFDHGDAMWDLLVVTGARVGESWLDRLTDGGGLRPAESESGGPIGFAEHYCRWLAG